MGTKEKHVEGMRVESKHAQQSQSQCMSGFTFVYPCPSDKKQTHVVIAVLK